MSVEFSCGAALILILNWGITIHTHKPCGDVSICFFVVDNLECFPNWRLHCTFISFLYWTFFFSKSNFTVGNHQIDGFSIDGIWWSATSLNCSNVYRQIEKRWINLWWTVLLKHTIGVYNFQHRKWLTSKFDVQTWVRCWFIVCSHQLSVLFSSLSTFIVQTCRFFCSFRVSRFSGYKKKSSPLFRLSFKW